MSEPDDKAEGLTLRAPPGGYPPGGYVFKTGTLQSIQPPAYMAFSINGNERVRFCASGEVLVDGQPVQSNRHLVAALVECFTSYRPDAAELGRLRGEVERLEGQVEALRGERAALEAVLARSVPAPRGRSYLREAVPRLVSTLRAASGPVLAGALEEVLLEACGLAEDSWRRANRDREEADVLRADNAALRAGLIPLDNPNTPEGGYRLRGGGVVRDIRVSRGACPAGTRAQVLEGEDGTLVIRFTVPVDTGLSVELGVP